MIAALARPPLALLRNPWSWIPVIAWSALAIAFAVTARFDRSSHGADHVLVGGYGALVLPLLAYTLVGRLVGARSLSASTAPLVAFGAPAARVAAVTIGIAVGACALAGSATAAIVAAVAHGLADPPLGHDAFASAYAGALGGGVYGAWFSFGASFGRRGGGRSALLVADWLLGTTGSVAAVFTPRAHLRNVLGGTPPMDLSERVSALAIVAIALACALLAIRRAR